MTTAAELELGMTVRLVPVYKRVPQEFTVTGIKDLVRGKMITGTRQIRVGTKAERERVVTVIVDDDTPIEVL